MIVHILLGALYHPPRPTYQPSSLLDYLEKCTDALNIEFPAALVILAGDFNTLDDTDVISRTALNSIVDQPTRGVSSLDRVYVSDLCDLSVKVVESAVRSDHKAVVANTGPPLRTVSKRRERRVFRRRSPARYAEFLQHISQLAITLPDNASPQTSFDDMYNIMRNLLVQFYPERETTVTSEPKKTD